MVGVLYPLQLCIFAAGAFNCKPESPIKKTFDWANRARLSISTVGADSSVPDTSPLLGPRRQMETLHIDKGENLF